MISVLFMKVFISQGNPHETTQTAKKERTESLWFSCCELCHTSSRQEGITEHTHLPPEPYHRPKPSCEATHRERQQTMRFRPCPRLLAAQCLIASLASLSILLPQSSHAHRPKVC